MVQTGGDADIEKYSKRTVRVTAQHNEECRRLLQLMGVPVIEVSSEGACAARYCHTSGTPALILLCLQAPSEAEAQCAQMCKEGLVRCTA